MKKRLLTFLLCAAMTASLMPAYVFAGEVNAAELQEETETDTDPDEGVTVTESDEGDSAASSFGEESGVLEEGIRGHGSPETARQQGHPGYPQEIIHVIQLPSHSGESLREKRGKEKGDRERVVCKERMRRVPWITPFDQAHPKGILFPEMAELILKLILELTLEVSLEARGRHIAYSPVPAERLEAEDVVVIIVGIHKT